MRLRRFAKSLLPPAVLHAVRGLRDLRMRRPSRWHQINKGVLRGVWFFSPPHGGMASGAYEQTLVERLIELVEPNWVCYDVGAHVGYYSLILAKLVGAGGRVHAFEPLPANVRQVRLHAERNRLEEVVQVHPFALSDTTGRARFRGPVGTRGRGLRRGQGYLVGVRVQKLTAEAEKFSEIEVEQRRLDDIVDHGEIERPNFLKIDVEGAELHVLRGARQTLARARPVIAAELHTAANAVECTGFFHDLGYEVTMLEAPSDGRCLILALPAESRAKPAS